MKLSLTVGCKPRRVRLEALLLMLPSAVGCSADASDIAEFSHAELEVLSVSSELINESPSIGRPSQIEVSDSLLWVKDAMDDPALHAVDRGTGELILSVGRRGDGPGEFHRGARDVSVRPGGEPGTIWAFDLTLQRLTHFDVEEALRADSRVITLAGPHRVLRAFWMDRNVIIGVGRTEEARFVRFDSTGQMASEVPGDLLGDRALPLSVRQTATISGHQACGQVGRGFALLYFATGRIELYDSGGVFRSLAAVPYDSDARFTYNEETSRWRQVYNRRWYVSCTATHEHLYAVFSGRSFAEYDRAEANQGRFVHVFSWDSGALVRVLRLDRPVYGVGVTVDGSVLYASSADAKIYRVDLSTSADSGLSDPRLTASGFEGDSEDQPKRQ